MRNYFTETDLLRTPANRAAFSDRTAYLMAEMSRLAYFKFEGGNNISEIVEKVEELFPDHKNLITVVALIKSQGIFANEDDSRGVLAEILEQKEFSLVETFSDLGTGAQAFLCTKPAQDIAILAFRGTEPSLKDIKADVKARLASVDTKGKPLPPDHMGKSVQIHSGYLAQFNSIRGALEERLAAPDIKDLQLYINWAFSWRSTRNHRNKVPSK